MIQNYRCSPAITPFDAATINCMLVVRGVRFPFTTIDPKRWNSRLMLKEICHKGSLADAGLANDNDRNKATD